MKSHSMLFCMVLSCIVAIATGLEPAAAVGQNYDNYYYVNVQDIKIFSQPDLNSVAWVGLHYAHEVRKMPTPKKSPSGWMYVEYHRMGKSGLFTGWVRVREESVVPYNAFKKLGRNWPIRYYCYWKEDISSAKDDDPFFSALTEGGKTFETIFERNGSARVIISDESIDWYGITQDEPTKPGPKSYSGQMYYYAAIMMLRYDKDEKVGFTFGLYARDVKNPSIFGGESRNVAGQGKPTSASQQAYVATFAFDVPSRLGANALKHCKNAPKQ